MITAIRIAAMSVLLLIAALFAYQAEGGVRMLAIFFGLLFLLAISDSLARHRLEPRTFRQQLEFHRTNNRVWWLTPLALVAGLVTTALLLAGNDRSTAEELLVLLVLVSAYHRFWSLPASVPRGDERT
ncbi:MAG: hypothetical protein JJ896_06480 [Rhodothermales bacterium]|nr:hypothetical protein [Rhodothermales bacterium]MBO6779281.1 hypothetical protein [Rhodothermales bacterium]